MNKTDAKRMRGLLLLSFGAGGAFAIMLLMAMGETGGSYLRSIIRSNEADYAVYREQCEASLNKALGSLTMAEGMHRDLAQQRDEARRGR